tara:strand:- start:8935 stop:9636 length:702 start_codon:yes stop_codon:yes gene_type:complete
MIDNTFKILTQEQIQDLKNNSYTKLPQISFKDEIYNLDNIIQDKSKTYSTNTEIHNAYTQHYDIKKNLAEDLKSISNELLGINPKLDDIYDVTRIVRAEDQTESYRFHFDSHLFTLVTPIIIPSSIDEESGQLLTFPGLRGEPSNELMNILQKTFYKKINSKESSRKLSLSKKMVEFNFKDNVPLLFLGRQTLHANRSFFNAINGTRITLLTHFFDPSPKYGIGSVLRKIRNR